MGPNSYPIQVTILYLPTNLCFQGPIRASVWWSIKGWITSQVWDACISLKQWGRHRLTRDTLVYEALFTWQLSPLGASFTELTSYLVPWCWAIWYPSQLTVYRSRDEKPAQESRQTSASECQKTKHSLSNIRVHCEEIYNKKKGSHAGIPGSISLKVIPFAAMKGSQDAL